MLIFPRSLQRILGSLENYSPLLTSSSTLPPFFIFIISLVLLVLLVFEKYSTKYKTWDDPEARLKYKVSNSGTSEPCEMFKMLNYKIYLQICFFTCYCLSVFCWGKYLILALIVDLGHQGQINKHAPTFQRPCWFLVSSPCYIWLWVGLGLISTIFRGKNPTGVYSLLSVWLINTVDEILYCL